MRTARARGLPATRLWSQRLRDFRTPPAGSLPDDQGDGTGMLRRRSPSDRSPQSPHLYGLDRRIDMSGGRSAVPSSAPILERSVEERHWQARLRNLRWPPALAMRVSVLVPNEASHLDSGRAGSKHPSIRRSRAQESRKRASRSCPAAAPTWKRYWSSQTSSMRQPLNRLLTIRVSPLTCGCRQVAFCV